MTIISSFSRCAFGDHSVGGGKLLLNARFPCLQIPPNGIEQVLVILDWETCVDGRAEKAAVVVHDAEAVINKRLDL